MHVVHAVGADHQPAALCLQQWVPGADWPAEHCRRHAGLHVLSEVRMSSESSTGDRGLPEKSWLIQVMPWRLLLSAPGSLPSVATCTACSKMSGMVLEARHAKLGVTLEYTEQQPTLAYATISQSMHVRQLQLRTPCQGRAHMLGRAWRQVCAVQAGSRVEQLLGLGELAQIPELDQLVLCTCAQALVS